MSHRLGEVVQVDGGEAEEVVAAEPTDCRHASFSPLSLSLSTRAGGEQGRRRAQQVGGGALSGFVTRLVGMLPAVRVPTS